MGQQPQAEVRRDSDRFVTAVDGRTTRHSFSFGGHYDPANVGLGFLVCHNEDLVHPGHGYDEHPHRELEIVTWVLGGVLRHADSTGRGGEITPGLVQRLSAGSGVLHTETNAGPEPVHFVQMWVRPDEPGVAPSYAQREVGAELDGGGWTTLASGIRTHAETTAVPLRNRAAGLHAARLRPGGRLLLPDAPLLHLFVARGTVDLEQVGTLAAGDAARLHRSGGRRITSGTAAEVLLWEMHP